MADVSLDDLIKKDKEKNKAQRSNNVLAILSRKPSKRNPFTNRDTRVNQSKAPNIQINNSLISLTSKINTTTDKSSKGKNSNALRTLKDQKNSNKTDQEKS